MNSTRKDLDIDYESDDIHDNKAEFCENKESDDDDELDLHKMANGHRNVVGLSREQFHKKKPSVLGSCKERISVLSSNIVIPWEQVYI
jgi:hypothetical protein